MRIMTISDYRAAIRQGRYAWPGGYPLYFICDDGGALCVDCARKERRPILGAISYGGAPEWRVVAVDINWEDSDLQCDNCYQHIESAYGEDATAESVS